MTLPFRSVVDLSYQLLRSNQVNCSKPIILNLHGFLGSRNTFHALNKVIQQDIGTDIYSIDIRNHGNSPQCHPMSYNVLVNDLTKFIETNIDLISIQRRGISIIGFSMGGKIGLLSSLNSRYKKFIKKIVSIDMPPYLTPMLPLELHSYMDLIKEINEGKIQIKPGTKTWKEECVGILGWYFGAGFLSVRSNNKCYRNNDHLKYYLPIEEFPTILEDLKQWPGKMIDASSCSSKVLFLRGLYSPLFNDDYSLLKKHFPDNKVIEFKSGHNVLFEQFEKASQEIITFLQD